MPQSLQAGDVVPDFSLPSSTGGIIHLYDVLDRFQVVLFFYPKAFTPVCTAEVCGFRDSADEFTLRDAAVFGISSDTPETLARFGRQHGVSFPLLSDEGSTVRRSFGVAKMFGILPGRVTYVIGKDRTIKQVIVAGFRSDVHVTESLKRLQEAPIQK